MKISENKILCRTDFFNILIIGFSYLFFIIPLLIYGLIKLNIIAIFIPVIFFSIPALLPLYAIVGKSKITFRYLFHKKTIYSEEIEKIVGSWAHHEASNIKIIYKNKGKQTKIILPIGSNSERELKTLNMLSVENFNKIDIKSFGNALILENGQFFRKNNKTNI